MLFHTHTSFVKPEALQMEYAEHTYNEKKLVSLEVLQSSTYPEERRLPCAETHKEDLRVEEQAPPLEQTVTAIMNVLEGFSLQQRGNDIFLGREVFSPRVRRHVAAGRTIPMVLPAFPAKSINCVDKVLGPWPDLGEELALDRLNDLCSQIQKVYRPGAMVLIATDGACYNGNCLPCYLLQAFPLLWWIKYLGSKLTCYPKISQESLTAISGNTA